MVTDNTLKKRQTVIDISSSNRVRRCKENCGGSSGKDHALPRYTSYPTADRFVETFTQEDYLRYLNGGPRAGLQALSLYLHIPYCQSLCYYCACNKKVTSRYHIEPFLNALFREMEMVSERLGDTPFTQMHWGGGTPTFLNMDDIRIVFEQTQQHFNFADRPDFDIEIDPRTVDSEKIDLLATLGFNRTSLGIQDFDLAVQKKINRLQPFEMVSEVVSELRRVGMRSINFDLIIGLPLQTVDRFSATIDQVVALRPDRLALYNYAHLPQRFKAQRLLDVDEIPSSAERLAMFESAAASLRDVGYLDIGMDHFALPDDELAVARRTGHLHRNFQGYTAQAETDLIGLGPSAISKLGACYSQNTRSLRDYLKTINHSVLPIDRGIELTREDVLRRSVINAVMCQNLVDKRAIEVAHLIDFDNYFAAELRHLKPLEDAGWVSLSPDSIVVTEEGRRVSLRRIAFEFDKYAREAGAYRVNARVRNEM
jgi:oxygen-independent coproporphyrinogen-3 oxidase